MSPAMVEGRRQAGFALLIVLWTMALLALVGMQIASSGRSEAQLAGNLRAAAAAGAAADGAVYEAVFHLVDGSERHWVADGRTYSVDGPGGGTAQIRMEDERARIGLNEASAPLLQALMVRLDVTPERAAGLAAAILDWRTAVPRARPLGAKEPEYHAARLGYAPPDASFERVGELGLVLGMTPDIVRRLSPFLTVYQTGGPDLAIAAPVVAQAARDAGETGSGPGQSGNAQIVLISVVASMPGNGVATRRVEARIGAGTQGRSYQILNWAIPAFGG
jgi:general secretion pathway protein K